MQRIPSQNARAALHIDEDVGYVDGGPGTHVLFQLPGPAACASVTDDGTHLAYVPHGSRARLYLQRHQGGTAWNRHVLVHDVHIRDVHWEEEGSYHTLRVEDENGAEWRAEWDGEWRLRRIDA